MTQAGAYKVMEHLMMYYPKQYPPDMPQNRLNIFVEDTERVYERYKDEDVIAVYKEMLGTRKTSPYAADVLQRLSEIVSARRPKSEHADGETTYINGEKCFWSDGLGNNPIGWTKVAPMPRYMQERLKVWLTLPPGEKDPHDGKWYKEKYGV